MLHPVLRESMNTNKINYQRELEKKLEEMKRAGNIPRLLLHSCCAPCSSYCLEYLNPFFEITVFYFNPNITVREEYELRLAEQRRLIEEMPFVNPVKLLEGPYDPESFICMAKGLENEPERGSRCRMCYALRLKETAQTAAREGFDFFATTLTLSPLKDPYTINPIGIAAGESAGAQYLCTDFKKKGGYLRSIELSKQYGLYRQNYCGCIYSRKGVGDGEVDQSGV